MEMLIDDNLEKILKLYQDRAQAIFNFNAYILLALDLKGHRLIGQCRKISSNHYRIRLHKELAKRYGETYLHDVIPHELAHAIVMEQYKKRVKPHGKEYKAVLAALEGRHISPRHRPIYELIPSGRNMRRFEYTCGCKNKIHKLSAIRHNRIERGSHIYTCKVCKDFLNSINFTKQ